MAALDVNYGQLAWKIRQDPRVAVFDEDGARSAEAGEEGSERRQADEGHVDDDEIVYATSAAMKISPTADIFIRGRKQFVSRGGKKLQGALDAFKQDVAEHYTREGRAGLARRRLPLLRCNRDGGSGLRR